MSEEARTVPLERVGPYRLLTRIGEGGMGVVHLAQGPDGDRVAVKVLRPHIVGDDEARERLAREVNSLRRVTSPRIAEIIDADPWGETPFVATRYVPGLTLHQHVKREGPIPAADLAWFAACLAEAVIAVHSVGVLHRDIKPSNILLEGRAPVLIDFGLARLAEDPRLTVTGWLLGTPGYLAPEILYGDEATTASDVHSWAATVVFAATGHPPFGTGPAMAIMDRVRRGEHDLSGVPADVLPLVRQCLSPDPADRPETAAVLAALRRPARTPDGDGGEVLTMPFALFGNQDDDATDVLAPTGYDDDATGVLAPTGHDDGPTEVLAPTDPGAEQTRSQAAPETPPTRPLTVPVPRDQPAEPVHRPARAPYMTPPPPRHPYPARPAEARPAQPSGSATLQRWGVLLGLWGLVAVGFALAPYLCLAAVVIAVLALRTFSWAADSVHGRRMRRGGSRWYDGTLAVLMSPWYLVVAVAGTVLLVVGATVAVLLVGTVALLSGLPTTPGLLVTGAALGLSLWWGPGSRRLRLPTHQLARSLTRGAGAGWASVAVLALLVALCGFALLDGGTFWTPEPGPPWRQGTVLGDVFGIG